MQDPLCIKIDDTYKTIKWASSREYLSSGFRQGEVQTSLLSYRDYLEIWNFASGNSRYDTFQSANNKGADQTARIRAGWVCALVVGKSLKTGILA